MMNKIYKSYLPLLLAFIFACCVVFSSQDNYAQGFYKITDKIGGSGSSTGQTGDTGSSSSTLIIVGAAVIAGFLVYKLVLDKDKPIKDTTKDTASSGESLLSENINNMINNTSLDFKKMPQLPINLYAGIQNPDIIVPARKYFIGLVYNF